MHSLAHNELGDAGAAAVAAFLARTECLLTSLSLAYNEIRDEGAASVFGSLCRNTRLKVLDLSFNGVRECKPLAELLRALRSLRRAPVRWCPQRAYVGSLLVALLPACMLGAWDPRCPRCLSAILGPRCAFVFFQCMWLLYEHTRGRERFF